MKRIVIFLLLPLLGTAQPNLQPPALGFTIKGTLEGIPDSTEVMLVNGIDGKTITTTRPSKGSFTLKGKLSGPVICQVVFGKKRAVDLFMTNETANIKGNYNDLGNVSITSSSMEEDYKFFKQKFGAIIANLQAEAGKINAETDPSKKEAIMAKYNGYKDQAMQAANDFIKEKPSSPVSAFVLVVVQPLMTGPEEMEEKYGQLKPEAKQGYFAQTVEQMINSSKIGRVGTTAMEFAQNDVNGSLVKLSSFRGKYVLVDFWASWCRPCRAENPNVVNAYQHYKDKNFTVLGVSLDQSKDNWVSAIKQDGLTWTHVSDLQYWNNAVAKMYNITSIPANFLIDPNGKIIARDIRGEALEQKLQQVLK